MAKVYGSKSVAAVSSAASTVVIGPSATRSRIQFFPHPTLAYSVGFGEPAVVNKGVTVQPLGHPVVLSYDDLGEQIHSSVAIISTGAITVGVLETLGDCPCNEE